MYIYGMIGTQLVLFGIGTSAWPSGKVLRDAWDAGYSNCFATNMEHKHARMRSR